MGQILHGSAKTTHVVRTAIQRSKASIKELAGRYDLNPDNGIQFCDLPKNHSGPTARWRTHIFDLLCRSHEIEHRFTKPNHPWTNGQVKRMNRILKEATGLSRCLLNLARQA